MSLASASGEPPRFSRLKNMQFKCPVYSCFKTMSSPSNLKSHISRVHKDLEDLGVDVSPNGKIKYPPALVDNLLR